MSFQLTIKTFLIFFWISIVFSYILVWRLVEFVYKYLGAGFAILPFLVLALFHIQQCRRIKNQLFPQPANEPLFVQAEIDEDFTPFDTNLIRQYMQEIENQNFIYLKDFKLKPGRVGSLSFARLYFHPQHHCLAEISQGFWPGQKPTPVTLSIHSAFENDRIFGSAQFRPNVLSYVCRNNHFLWKYYPSAMPTQLLQYHLKDRQKIMEKLRVGLIPANSWEFYEQLQQQAVKINWQTFKNKNAFLVLIEATLYEIKPASQWLGDYAKIINLK